MLNLKLDSKSIGLESKIYLIAPEKRFNKNGRQIKGKKLLVYPAIISDLSFGHNSGDGHYSEEPVWLIKAVEVVPVEVWTMAKIFHNIPADRCFKTKAEAESALEMMIKENKNV